jgi:hypothetical protein
MEINFTSYFSGLRGNGATCMFFFLFWWFKSCNLEPRSSALFLDRFKSRITSFDSAWCIKYFFLNLLAHILYITFCGNATKSQNQTTDSMM